MKKITGISSALLALGLGVSPFQAQAQDFVDDGTTQNAEDIADAGADGQAVHDAKAYELQREQAEVMQNQLDQLRSQLSELEKQTDEARQQREAMTGNSGKGDIATADYADSIPRNWQETLDAYKNGGKVVSVVNDMQQRFDSEEEEQASKSNQEATRFNLDQGVKRSLNGSALNAEAYRSSVDRVEKLKALQEQIEGATTLKEISDLQARIHIENGMLTNELIRTQSMNAMLQQTEYAKAYQSVKDMEIDVDTIGDTDN